MPKKEDNNMAEISKKFVVRIKILKLSFFRSENPQRNKITGITIEKKPTVYFIRKNEAKAPKIPIRLCTLCGDDEKAAVPNPIVGSSNPEYDTMLKKSRIEKTDINIPRSFFRFSGDMKNTAGSGVVFFFFRLVAIIFPD